MIFSAKIQPNQVMMFEDSLHISGSTQISCYLDDEELYWGDVEYTILSHKDVSVSRSMNTYYFTKLIADEAVVKIRVSYLEYFKDFVINVFLIKKYEKQWQEFDGIFMTERKVGIGCMPDTADFKVYGTSEFVNKVTATDIRINRDIEVYNKKGFLKAVNGIVEYVDGELGGTYTNLEPMPEKVGGAQIGTFFDAVAINDVFDKLFYPYQDPKFTAFAIQGESAILEVGKTIAANRTFTWTTTVNINVTPNSIVIHDITNSAPIAVNIANSGSFVSTSPLIKKITAESHSFLINASSTKPATFSRNLTFNWQWMIYYGESLSTILDEAKIKGLRVKNLSAGYKGTYPFQELDNGYKYFCFPAQMVENVTVSFNDGITGISVPMDTRYTISVENFYGVTHSYYVYRSAYVLKIGFNIIVT